MATLTITTTSAQDARIVSAFGKYLNLTDGNGDPRNATGPEVKAAVINFVKQIVFDQEDKALKAAANANPLGDVS